MDIASDAPQSRYYQSQGLKLHVTDWGNPAAPPLLLVHGGLDHSRSWDHLAQALRADFHVVAPTCAATAIPAGRSAPATASPIMSMI